jgi:hypothetical protein
MYPYPSQGFINLKSGTQCLLSKKKLWLLANATRADKDLGHFEHSSHESFFFLRKKHFLSLHETSTLPS